MKNKIKVALIFGGRSAEHEVSIDSAASVFKHLDTRKFTVSSIYITKKGEWKSVSSPLLPLKALARGRALPFLPWMNSKAEKHLAADIYFPVLHGPYGEDGALQGLFEMAGVPYVGTGVLASSLCMDKAVSKSVFRDLGLPVVRHKILLESEWKRDKASLLKNIRKELPFPVFVKPANLGSSVGITKVLKPAGLEKAVATALRYDRKVLVEEGIPGREWECSVLGNDNPRASLPGEVIPHSDFYDYRDKYIDGKTKFDIPAKLPAPLVRKIQDCAVEAFKAVDGCGMARVDFLFDEKKKRLYINEINTIPGFTAISMYPKLWDVSGLPYAKLIEELIRLGFERHRRKKICVDRGRS